MKKIKFKLFSCRAVAFIAMALLASGAVSGRTR